MKIRHLFLAAAALAMSLGTGAVANAAPATHTTSAVALADQSPREFTATGTATKPPQALQSAAAKAQHAATAAGYGQCETVDESIEFNPVARNYTATVTISCVAR